MKCNSKYKFLLNNPFLLILLPILLLPNNIFIFLILL